MKVLFITRPTVFSGPGGDTVQLLKTAEYLEAQGIDVTFAENPLPGLNDYDLVHFFNLRNPQDLLVNVRRVKEARIPSVLSTIWGSYYECDVKTRHGMSGFISRNIPENTLEYLKALGRVFKNINFNKNMIPYFLKGHLSAQKEIVSSVDVLLPNSPTELERVRRDMHNASKKGVVVANAVDTKIFDYDNVVVDDKYMKYQGCILSAARVEARKCQLDLIRSVNNTSYQLVIVGRPSPNSKSYYEACVREAGSNVHFISHVEHHELAQLYKVAKVHALISWMETPGLSSLEAGVMNCNLVVTNRGDTEYYFQNYVEYVEPGSVESIREGLVKAMEKPLNTKLKNRIIENFTWSHTAEQTYAGYKVALAGAHE